MMVMVRVMMMMMTIMTIVSVEQRPGWGEHVSCSSCVDEISLQIFQVFTIFLSVCLKPKNDMCIHMAMVR